MPAGLARTVDICGAESSGLFEVVRGDEKVVLSLFVVMRGWCSSEDGCPERIHIATFQKACCQEGRACMETEITYSQ